MSNWWENAIVYQIYPRSYQDSNGDGVGDLPGIIDRLDYLAYLGITAVWISPCFPSPMADFGYDVSDYKDIHPLFGTLADMDRLIEEAHARGIKVLLDLVPNHSSNEHPWFLESRSSRDNPKRDWYYWRDPVFDVDGVRQPPNNWLAHFGGGSAWEWDEKTGQYYLHLFLAEQPDLNWRNPEVKEAMLDVMRFWFDKGIDGFRVDVSYKVMKDLEYRDNPPDPDWEPGMNPFHRLLQTYSENQVDNHDFNRWLREVADEYGDRVLIGEIYLPIDELVKHYGRNADEFHLPFNFHLIRSEWDADVIRDLIESYEAALPEGAWPNWVLGNHDQHRFVTREGVAHARVGMMLLLTLRGTPTLYYGEELGMEDGDIPLDKLVDPAEINAPGMGLGRDPERVPMQWDDSPNAGFTTPEAVPWLPVGDNYKLINVADQRERPDSMLTYTRRLIALRQKSEALLRGSYRAFDAGEDVLAYAREKGDERLIVVLNLGFNPRTWTLPSDFHGKVIFSTRLDDGAEIRDGLLYLRRHEGVILQ